MLLSLNSLASYSRDDPSDQSDRDLLLIHSIDSESSAALKININLFDNDQLKGSPMVEISPTNVTFFEDNKESKAFSDFYKNKKFDFKLAKDKLKNLNIRTYNDSLALILESENNGIIETNYKGKKLYFRLPSKGRQDTYFLRWRSSDSFEQAKNFILSSEKNKLALTKFRKCVEQKNVECLLSLDKNYIHAVQSYTIRSDEKLCELYQARDKYKPFDIPQNQKLKANWELYSKLANFEADKELTEASLSAIEFGKDKFALIKMVSESVCGESSLVIMTYNETNGKEPEFKIELDPY